MEHNASKENGRRQSYVQSDRQYKNIALQSILKNCIRIQASTGTKKN